MKSAYYAEGITFLRKPFISYPAIDDDSCRVLELANEIEIVDDSPAEASTVLEEQFAKLSQQWKSETGGYSVTSRRYAHPAYQSILMMAGKDKDEVIAFILKELQRRPDWWFQALEVLTGENPVKRTDDFRQAINAWVTWGKNNHKI